MTVKTYQEGQINLPEDPYQQVIFRGKPMDAYTMAVLLEAEAELGYRLTVVQGGFNKGGVAASAGTHDKGGVGDLTAYDHENKIKVMADLGTYPYHRYYLPGVWGEHIHFGVRNHKNRAPLLVEQQVDWDHKPPRNGLVGHANLTGQYYPSKLVTYDYKPGKAFQVPQQTQIEIARDHLVTAIHEVAQAAAALDSADPSRKVAHAQVDELKADHKNLRNILKVLPKK